MAAVAVMGCLSPAGAAGQAARIYTRADTLRGSFTTPAARGGTSASTTCTSRSVRPTAASAATTPSPTACSSPASEMQIDLMVPLEVDSMVQDGQRRRIPARRQRVLRHARRAAAAPARRKTITVYYHGRPQIARRPPWQGGFTWTADSLGRPWVVTTDQGMGASVWWPNKDTQADEPDSQRVALTRARSDDRRVERPAAQHDAAIPTARRRTSGSS